MHARQRFVTTLVIAVLLTVLEVLCVYTINECCLDCWNSLSKQTLAQAWNILAWVALAWVSLACVSLASIALAWDALVSTILGLA